MSLLGKDIISTQFLSIEDIKNVLELAIKMKKNRYDPRWSTVLKDKVFLMFFFNPSLRTRISFEIAALELGGHAIYYTPTMGRFKDRNVVGESIEDAAQVMSRFVAGIGIRAEDIGERYGAGNDLLNEYAKWASVPIINMADDRFHPCQGLSDILGWSEWFSKAHFDPVRLDSLRGKNLLITWAKGALHRSRTSPQESLLLASRFGMNITIARPNGYDLEPQVYQWAKEHCSHWKSTFKIIDDPEKGYEGAHVVYSRNWISEGAYDANRLQKQLEVEKSLEYDTWMTTIERMKLTDNAIFTHPMPVDRDNEVVSSIASSPHSVIYNVAENRLHVQKAIMALTMGNGIP
jgi:ornithine carbamoyltransferase